MTTASHYSEAMQRQAAADAARALAEDIGAGDLSAPLAGAGRLSARLLCREKTVLCGVGWFEECFRQLDKAADFEWRKAEGAELADGEIVCELDAPAAAVLAAERSALNFLQTLSATAAAAKKWQKLAGAAVAVLDTRKTLPLLRAAQKYAVKTGGAHNHRFGLYDEILIKENHIAAAGGIAAALEKAFACAPKERVQIEVQNREELRQAAQHGARRILLDNFSPDEIRAAAQDAPEAELEASGGINEDNIAAVAAAGVQRISVGAMTKNIRAADFSLLARHNGKSNGQ